MRHSSDHSFHTAPIYCLSIQAFRRDQVFTRITFRSAAVGTTYDSRNIDYERKHQEYLDNLQVPSLAQVEAIAEVQERKERDIQKFHNSKESEESQAASTIQRNYRGYKTRRELAGLGLDPSTRWVEAVREAQYRNLTRPRPRISSEAVHDEDSSAEAARDAKQNWHHVSGIARYAHGVMPEVEEEDTNDKHKFWHKDVDPWRGKMMDLPYFLEMVDQKHRYGSNLRAYHAEWKKSDTHENYFYWLDHGEGRNVEIPKVSRARLEREQVRYLSREERLQYLVVVDHDGRLCWAKNGERLDTSTDFRDSVEGIVPTASSAKVFREDELKDLADGVGARDAAQDRGDESSDDEISVYESGSSSSASSIRYPDPPDMKRAKGVSKLKHVSAGVILNRLLRKSTKKNTWIFVADTSMNLYVGIKQSGSFQHSSFINGSRISAAGLIKIKQGQLRSLSPLSGHYRPPAAAFRHFIEHLKEEKVDMSRVSISKAYAVLVGLETYLGTKKRIGIAGDKVKHGIEHVVDPEKAEARKEMERDKSQSAALEEKRLQELEAQKGLNKVVRDVRARVERLSEDSRSIRSSTGAFHKEETIMPHRTKSAGTGRIENE